MIFFYLLKVINKNIILTTFFLNIIPKMITGHFNFLPQFLPFKYFYFHQGKYIFNIPKYPFLSSFGNHCKLLLCSKIKYK